MRSRLMLFTAQKPVKIGFPVDRIGKVRRPLSMGFAVDADAIKIGVSH